MEYVIEMLNITKRFKGIVANDNVTFKLKKGEIHALLGENGAGKSTLMSVLFGLYEPEEGIIKLNGEEVKIKNPNIANQLGIGMVHQHFKLIENFTVTENIILGMEPKKSFNRINMKEAEKQVKNLSIKYGLNINPKEKIENLDVSMQQRVEILKMLYRNSNVLIFDEPTAVLTPQAIKEFMKILKRLVEEGKSIILITHKLNEIKYVSDRCTILRKGKFIKTVDVKDTSTQEMANLMVGRNVNFKVEKSDANPTDVVLSIKNLNVKNSRNLPAIKNLNLEIKRGEILCVAGIDGNGQNELVDAITGIIPSESGSIKLNGEEIINLNVRKRTEKNIGYIPQDRHKYGLVLDFNIEENMALQTYYKDELSKNGLINFNNRSKFSKELIESFDIRCSNGNDTIVRSMSGGNQQKIIIAREIFRSPDLLIASQPTRGLDVGAIEYIHKKLIEERDKNKAVLLISLEMDEVLNVSDRIAVIYEGNIVGELDSKDADETKIGYMMAGGKI